MEKSSKTIEGLKPYEKQLYLLYRCPKCQGEWRVTLEEATLIGRQICYCGRLLVFAPITDVRILVKHANNNYEKLIDTPPLTSYSIPRTVAVPANPLFDDTVSALASLGYKNKEAQKIALKLVQANPNSTVDELLRSFLSPTKGGVS